MKTPCNTLRLDLQGDSRTQRIAMHCNGYNREETRCVEQTTLPFTEELRSTVLGAQTAPIMPLLSTVGYSVAGHLFNTSLLG